MTTLPKRKYSKAIVMAPYATYNGKALLVPGHTVNVTLGKGLKPEQLCDICHHTSYKEEWGWGCFWHTETCARCGNRFIGYYCWACHDNGAYQTYEWVCNSCNDKFILPMPNPSNPAGQADIKE